MIDDADTGTDIADPAAAAALGSADNFTSVASPQAGQPSSIVSCPTDAVRTEPNPTDEPVVLDEPQLLVGHRSPSVAIASPPHDSPAEPMTGDGLRRVRLFGLDLVDAPSLDPVIDRILDRRHDEHPVPVVLTPNVDILVHLDRNPGWADRELFRTAQYCLPDGEPLVLFSRLFGRPLGTRLAGSDLFAELWPEVVRRRIAAVVVASSEEIAGRLRSEHPAVEVIVPPQFEADDNAAVERLVERMLDASRAVGGPELIFVGIGHPKDARLIGALRKHWDLDIGPMPLAMGLGGSFAFYLGLTKRAPRWIQRLSMEWFYRFLQEPRRLFWRYFVRDLGFLPIVWREYRAQRRRNGRVD
jgi:N-acetylglucosaminyldiphosphoundecaprenol N-acetyl-beta-D-mannosaminyltransferase